MLILSVDILTPFPDNDNHHDENRITEMDRDEIKADFKAAAIKQFREAGHVGLVTDEASDTGKQYAIWSDYIIPLAEANALVLEALDEVEQ